MVSRKTSLNKCKIIETTQNMFSDQVRIKLESNKIRKLGNPQVKMELSNTLKNNVRVKEEITGNLESVMS